MTFAWARRAALGALALASACNGGGQAAPHPSSGGGDGGPLPASAIRFNVDPGLECADAGAAGICVAPSQVVTLAIDGEAGTSVALSLQGSYADAALATDHVTLTGTPARVTLESSSTPATFTVLARAAGAAQAVALTVTVATSGLATIEASAAYTGHRPTKDLYASGFVLSTCAELTASTADASVATWTSGSNMAPIALMVPAGERAAVQMRAGHYAFGCADVDPLVTNAALAVSVQIYDVPMALALTNLTAVLSLTADATAASAWQAVGQAAVARVEAAFFGTQPDGPALLDAMRAAIGAAASQAQFDTIRQKGDWDSLATTWMASHTPTINARATAWLGAAAGDALGPLTLQIGNGTPTGTAPVTAVTLGALTWVAAGVRQPSPFQWTADANDTVHLAGEIDLTSTPLFAHLADTRAASSATGAVDVPSAIALGIDCAGLASSIVGSGVSYGTCGSSCTASLCSSALAAAWNAALAPAPGGTDVVKTAITASAPAQVGDMAEPAYVSGAWLGSVSGAGVPASVKLPFSVAGTLLATEAVTAPSP